ncbi:MAG: hypothetical protein RJS98_12075 [Rhodospirillaceae bacterium]
MESDLLTPPAARVGAVIVAAASVIFLAHLSYFAINVPPLEKEALVFSRTIACTSAALSLFLLNKVLSAWTGDGVVGASAALGFLLFPATAFVYGLFVPIAMLVFLFLLGVWLATVIKSGARFLVPLLIGGIVAALPFLASGGFYLSAALLCLVAIERPPKRFLMIAAGAVVLSGVALSYSFPGRENIVPKAWGFVSAPVLLDGVVRPYAMLWLGLAFSFCSALGSKSLRQRLSSVLVRRLVVIAIVFCLAMLSMIIGDRDGGTDLSLALALNAILPLGVMLTLPMVMWVRFVMPQIKSVWIWILLPVVMYSCFWVVLGPIDLGAFPYDQIGSRSKP